MLIFYESMVHASCVLALLKRIAIAQNSNNFINFQVEKLPSRNKTLPLPNKLDGAHQKQTSCNPNKEFAQPQNSNNFLE